MAGAAEAGEPVEDWSKRTETATVVANPDGSFTRTQYGTPLRIKRDGTWVDVDYTLERRADGSYAPKASPVDVVIGGGGSSSAASVTFEDGQQLDVTWPETLATPQVDGASARYKLSSAADLVVTAVTSGVSTHIVLNAPPAEDDPRFTLGLTTTQATLTETPQGGLKLTDDGDRVGAVSSMLAWDSKADAAGEPADVVAIDSTLEPISKSGDVTDHELELTPPEGYLSNPARQYPVTIDPDVSELTQARDTWVREGDSVYRNDEPRLVVGKIAGSSNTNAAMAYVQFAMADIQPSSVVSADLDLYQYFAGTCSARMLKARPLAQSWLAENTNYGNRPAVIAGSGDTTTISANRGAGCPTGAGITSMNVTAMAREWLKRNQSSSQGYPNFGLRLDVGEEGAGYSTYERRFCSFSSGKSGATPATSACEQVSRQPKMRITYNDPPATPTKLNVTYGGNPVTVYSTVRDPNRETELRARIVVKRGSTVVYDGYSNEVAVPKGGPGVEVKARLPYLPDGEYIVTSRAYDGLTASSTSAAKTFVVETEFGSQSWYSSTQHGLNDRSGVAVNNRTGNLTVQAGDIKVNGRGVDFNATRFYNSQSTQTTTQGVIPAADLWSTAMGKGWSLSVGPDVWLEKKSADKFDYHAPGGTVFGPFTRKSSDPDEFTKPSGGVGADLKVDGDGVHVLTFRNSQTRYEFDEVGPDGDLYQTKSKDRSGNEISFAYSGTTPNGRAKLATITDSANRTFTVTYTGDNITSITNPSGPGVRTWSYGYDSGGFLTSYTDPDSKTTNYDYVTSSTGTKLLSSIQNPQGANGQRTTTTVDYATETSDPANLDRVADVHYAKASGTIDFSWAYGRRSDDPTCQDKSDYSTNVDDGRAKTTSYCFEDSKAADQGGKVRVYDAEGHVKSSSFTTDKATAEVTTPLNQNAAGGSTVAQYGGNGITDQLNSVTEPKSEEDAGLTAGTTAFEYNASTSIPGKDYLPTNVTDSNGDCSKFEYDNKGRTETAYTGLAPASDGNCDPSAGGTGFHRKYNDDGTVSSSWDANASDDDNPPTSERTVYTYWAVGDAGYVGGTAGQAKTIRKPGGSCDSPRKLCTSYTYDSAARVQTVTDGRGKVTTYTYDQLDRTTAAYFDGTTSCAAGNTNCVTYTYDAEGNLTARVDKSGTSTFVYDRLNRQTKQTLPGGTVIDLAYDDNGNLTQHKQTLSGQAADVVDYVYDDANRLTSVIDAIGTTDITPNDDGRVKKIDFPGAGVQVNYDFKRSGKPKSATVKSDDGSTTLRDYDYSYIKQVTFPYIGAVEMESGQLQERTLSNAPAANTTTEYDYAKSRLQSAHNSNGALPDYDYEHDKVGNVTKEKIDAASTFYGYDRAGQLCWSGPNDGDHLNTTCQPGPTGATDLDHDAAGNNTGTTTTPRTYNDNSQLTSIGGVDMSYSDLGNDLRTEAGSTTFVNGPLGITAKKTGNNITYYTRDSNGTILNSHGTGGTVNYFSEFNGSVAALYSATGTELGSYRYSPYGQTTATGAAAEANPFRYIGGHQDKDNNGDDSHYKLGARYYDGHGHFTQPDPIVPGGGAYHYAEGDPINSFDPSGLKGEDPLCEAGSTGYYEPNCGGYITGGGGGDSLSKSLACTGVGLLNTGGLLLGGSSFFLASNTVRAGMLLTPGLAVATGTYGNPFAPTKAVCK